ncbi:MAG: ParB N-terminal domain-containing protein, partial [Trueperaceae bacterium]|nr:ParB N-terminal domain-containing protein [Trueperaceae bacterium]
MASDNVHNLDDLLAEGMDALLGEVTGTIKIPLGQLKDNPYQPRKYYDAKKLKELAASIEEYGLQTPIKVMRDSENPTCYIIVYG